MAAHVRAAVRGAARVGFRVGAVQVFIAGPRQQSITLEDDEAEELRDYLAETGIFAVAHGAYADVPWAGKPWPAKFIRMELDLCRQAGLAGLVIHLGMTPHDVVARTLPTLFHEPPKAGGGPVFATHYVLVSAELAPVPRTDHLSFVEDLHKLAAECDVGILGSGGTCDQRSAGRHDFDFRVDGENPEETVGGVFAELKARHPAVVVAYDISSAPWEDCGITGGADAGAPPAVYIETPAVKPENAHYETPEKLGALFKRIDAECPPEVAARVRLCVDTAHLWSCGVDLRTRADAEDWLERLAAQAALPPGRLMFHANDSEEPLGKGVDKHAPLFQGRMWSEFRRNPAASGFAAFAEYAARENVPLILERKHVSALTTDYELLQQLVPELRV
jgi:endonuclease IV